MAYLGEDTGNGFRSDASAAAEGGWRQSTRHWKEMVDKFGGGFTYFDTAWAYAGQ